MTIKGDVRVTGLKNFMRKVSNRNAKLNNLSPAFKRAVVLYHGWILKNFNAEGGLHDNASLRWKKSNRAKNQGGKTLQDTGRLRRDWDLRSSSSYGIIKSKVDYSSVHEEGATIPAMVIRPKNAKVLRWVGKDGVVRFAKSVKRPAIVIPQRKIFPTIAQAHDIIRPAFLQHLDWNKITIK